jgi:hypothetical protein
MAKYAIPAEVVFTFDDEPVDIQEMLHDNAESEEVVEGLERLLKAVAAPGFTEAEVVFDIGGGISVVRAARRTANPRPKSRVFEVEETHGLGDRTWQAYGEATVATVDGYKVAYQSRSFSNEQGQAGRAIPLNKATRYYALKADGTPDLDAYASKQSRGWSLTGGGDYGSDSFSNRRAALAYLSRVNLPGVREDNPRDDGQQSLPLDYGRTGNPKIKTLALKDGSDIQPLLPGTDFRRLKIPRGSSFIDLDLRGAIFDGLDLSGVKPNIPVHKQRIHFSGADLRGASFRGADLRNAIFMSAVVDGNTDFTGAIVDGADFAGAVAAVLSPQQLAVVLRRPDYGQRTGNPHGGGLVSGYGINTFAMDPDDYAPERQSNPRESIATMLGRPRR